MIAVPWYLFSLGIFIVIVGLLLGSVGRPRSDQALIDPAMDDEEILDSLRRQQQISFPSLVVLLGLALVMVSLVWRILRFFL